LVEEFLRIGMEFDTKGENSLTFNEFSISWNRFPERAYRFVAAKLEGLMGQVDAKQPGRFSACCSVSPASGNGVKTIRNSPVRTK
jgi:hypothetical protein